MKSSLLLIVPAFLVFLSCIPSRFYARLDIMDWLSVDNPTDKRYQRTNPYRDFPSDQVDALREILFIVYTFDSELEPTSLPDADHGFYSTLLRSLETRTDITWLISEETKICDAIERVHNRQEPTVDEGHDFKQRVKNLRQFWHEVRQPPQPHKWEPAYYSESLPPIIKSDAEAPIVKLPLTPEQEAQAEAIAALHLRKHARNASHLKDNPPNPMGFVPQERDAATSDEAWDLLYRPSELPMDPRGAAIFNDDVYRFIPIYMDVGLEAMSFMFSMSPEELAAFGKDQAEWDRYGDIKSEMQLERIRFRAKWIRELEAKEKD